MHLACCVFLGSTGCQPVVAGNPAGNIFANVIRCDANSRSRQAAETCRLAACAPQNAEMRALPRAAAWCEFLPILRVAHFPAQRRDPVSQFVPSLPIFFASCVFAFFC